MTAKTDQAGQIEFVGLTGGLYKAPETKPSSGYYLTNGVAKTFPGYSTFTQRRAAGEVMAKIASTDKVVEVIHRGVPEAPSIPKDSIIRTITVTVSTNSKPSRIHFW